MDFDIPENVSSEERSVRVDILLAKDKIVYDSFYGNDVHVDPGDNTWETIWEAVQLAYYFRIYETLNSYRIVAGLYCMQLKQAAF